MLKIRLQRVGKRGQAYFRVVVVEHTKKPKGEYLELLGSYNPHKKDLNVKKDRVEYWVSNGAQVSPTVNNLLVNFKVWDKPKVQSWKPKKKPAVPEKEKQEKPTASEATTEPEAPQVEAPQEEKAEEKSEPAPEESKPEEPKEEPKPEEPQS